MASNILKTGKKVFVFDVNKDASSKLKVVFHNELGHHIYILLAWFQGLGAHVVDSPAQIAKACSTVITMLPSSPHVRISTYCKSNHKTDRVCQVLEVYLGKDGILSSAAPGSLLIDCRSTSALSNAERSKLKCVTTAQLTRRLHSRFDSLHSMRF